MNDDPGKVSPSIRPSAAVSESVAIPIASEAANHVAHPGGLAADGAGTRCAIDIMTIAAAKMESAINSLFRISKSIFFGEGDAKQGFRLRLPLFGSEPNPNTGRNQKP